MNKMNIIQKFEYMLLWMYMDSILWRLYHGDHIMDIIKVQNIVLVYPSRF